MDGSVRGEAAGWAFRGPAPTVQCRAVSDADCDLPMSFTDEHCGNPTHVRVVRPGRRGTGVSLPRERHRPRLIVDEEFVFVEDIPGEDRSFDPDDFNPDDVWVSANTQRAFTAHHNVDAEEAIENVRLVLERARAANRHRRLPNGAHVFAWKGFSVVVTGDLEAAVRYNTNHYERTPRMVADGMKSRFRGVTGLTRRGRRIPTSDEKTAWAERLAAASVGDVIEGTVQNIVNFGIFLDIGEGDALLHTSEIIPALADHKAAFEIGQQLEVTVVSVDLVQARVNVCLRRENPGQPAS